MLNVHLMCQTFHEVHLLVCILLVRMLKQLYIPLLYKRLEKSDTVTYYVYRFICNVRAEMRFPYNENCPLAILIMLSGLVLVINQIMMHTRHTSTVYSKYYLGGSSLLHPEVPRYKYTTNQKLVENGHLKRSKYVPISDVATSYDKFKDVIPRTAYYGSRYIDGSNQDIIVVLAEVNASILEQNLIISCQWNDQYSTSVKIIPDPIMGWIQHNKKGYTHFFAMIYCFGLNPNPIISSDVVKIIYKTNGAYMSVNTEKSLRLLNNASHTKIVDSVMVCATMYGHPVRFEEWLRYQKTVGVDKIHLSVQVSFITGIERYQFLRESLANDFVEVEVWKQYLKNNEIFYYSQSLIYQDCVMRYQSSFEYAMMVDYDDFFIPVVANKKDIHYYVNRVFDENTASIKLPWIELPCAVRNYTFLVDGNVTQTFSRGDIRIKRTENKCIHRLNAVDIISIHQAYKIMPGYVNGQVEGVNLAYFAHIRPRKRFCTVR